MGGMAIGPLTLNGDPDSLGWPFAASPMHGLAWPACRLESKDLSGLAVISLGWRRGSLHAS